VNMSLLPHAVSPSLSPSAPACNMYKTAAMEVQGVVEFALFQFKTVHNFFDKINETNTQIVAPSHEAVQIMLSSRTQLLAQHILDQSSNEPGEVLVSLMLFSSSEELRSG